MAVFVRDEGDFLTSQDVQRFNIGTILTSGDLVPDSIQVQNNVVLHDHQRLSISIDPDICLSLLPDFFSCFQNDNEIKPHGLVFEVKVKNPLYWQTKIRFLMDRSQEKELEQWLNDGQFVVRKKDCIGRFCLPDMGGPAWARAKEAFSAQRGMTIMDPVKKDLTNLPSLEHNVLKFAFNAFNVPTDCQVHNTLETFGFPLPPANQLVIEMVLNAMKQLTDFQTYVKDTKTLRDIEPTDLPCTLLSGLSQCFTPS